LITPKRSPPFCNPATNAEGGKQLYVSPDLAMWSIAMRKRKTKREQFLKLMDEIIPWDN
jgi:hypothetical protein